LCIFILSQDVLAAEEETSFLFDLTVNGEHAAEVKTGDIITVVLKLKRTDDSEPYTMYAMQDELRYDSTFFQLVEENTILDEKIISTDIAMVDRYREFYINFLSMSGGELWNEETFLGSIQLKVVGNSGVTKITNQDYLVSYQDGSSSYTCEANDVTIILSTECIIRFMTNGGSEIENQVVQYGEKIIRPDDPIREGYQLAGWYKDINLTDEWDFEEDIVQGNMSLYAKWVEAENPPENDFCWWLLLLIAVVIICFYYYKNKKDKK